MFYRKKLIILCGGGGGGVRGYIYFFYIYLSIIRITDSSVPRTSNLRDSTVCSAGLLANRKKCVPKKQFSYYSTRIKYMLWVLKINASIRRFF